MDRPYKLTLFGHVGTRDGDLKCDYVTNTNIVRVVDVDFHSQFYLGEELAERVHVGKLDVGHADQTFLRLHRGPNVFTDGLTAAFAALDVANTVVGEVRNLVVSIPPSRKALDQTTPEFDNGLAGHHPTATKGNI
ncbi:-L-isoaspartate(D-aspartate) O-methyltransferase, putative [Babesia ovata]|uniref:-L-isoaspartate(D-aspartate) O-methyltransferase, putative n=1 Tax=Babesia ovata TaxID=189622 RepID=A0A2H6KCD0_9APIC|nr:-L-isoaspartate(D-aspartate) O-methyltransferase, putative [Babesia ovata]GBE60645.1 -L-isoaspartate(D-aspartate) O-methyltransferase, putative [Babesia ovata]